MTHQNIILGILFIKMMYHNVRATQIVVGKIFWWRYRIGTLLPENTMIQINFWQINKWKYWNWNGKKLKKNEQHQYIFHVNEWDILYLLYDLIIRCYEHSKWNCIIMHQMYTKNTMERFPISAACLSTSCIFQILPILFGVNQIYSATWFRFSFVGSPFFYI